MRIITLLFNFIITVGVCQANAAFMTWIPTNNIQHPNNWINKSPYTEDCTGIIFSSNSFNFAVLDSTYSTDKLVLPRNGEITIIDGATIKFTQEHKECILLRPLELHSWTDPKNWHFFGTGNPAVPDLARIPCPYSNVLLNEDVHSFVELPVLVSYLKVKSLYFGEDAFVVPGDQPALDKFLDSSLGRTVFRLPMDSSPIRILGEECADQLDCVCEPFDLFSICEPNAELRHKCLNPVKPLGFCEHICGAYLLFEFPKLKETSIKVERLLFTTRNGNKDGVSINKMVNGTNEVLQIVFTEHEFTGKSLEEASAFVGILKNDLGIIAELYSSGDFYEEGLMTSKFFSITFGTLFTVLILFAIIYVFYETSLPDRYLNNRMSYIWARYDKRSEPKLIFGEGSSIAGSVLSLENPMYGHPTSSDTFERVEAVDDNDDPRANPLFELSDINKSEEQLENVKQEKLSSGM